MTMNMNQLKIFHMVAKLQSFTRASEALFLTQPGISKHIKQLEEYYGIKLFDRLGKKVIPTHAGTCLLETTEKLFLMLDETKEKIDDLKSMKGGKLNIGASFTTGIYIVPKIIGRFSKKYPDIKISLDISLNTQIGEKILSNELDIGFLGAPVTDDRIIAKRFLTDELVIIFPKSHKWEKRHAIKPAELATMPFILSKKGSGTRSVLEEMVTIDKIKFCKIIEFGNTEAVKKAVENGMGVSILSKHAVESEISSGVIKTAKLAGKNLERTFYVAYHKDKYMTNAAKELLSFVYN